MSMGANKWEWELCVKHGRQPKANQLLGTAASVNNDGLPDSGRLRWKE